MKRSLLALALFAPVAFAQRPTVNSSSAASGGDYTTSTNARAIGVGIQHTVGPDNVGMNQIHVMFEISNRMLVGGGFGFTNEFDNALVTGDFRFNLTKRGAASLYLEAIAGWARVATAGGTENGLLLAPLFGFNYALTDNLQLNAGYGIEIGIGDAFTSKVSLTNLSPLGNFGVHWYF